MRPFGIAQLLFPAKCVLCGALLEREEEGICDSCAESAPVLTGSREKLPYLDGWVALWHYEGKVVDSIQRYKFQGVRAYAREYGCFLARKLRAEYPEGFDLLTWVPISGMRKFRRGFDQGQLLAEFLGEELDMVPVRLLKKLRNNRVQSKIQDPSFRRANVMGVYRVVDPQLVRGKRILLLDDVITTGATAGECARMLLMAGAKEVYCGAVAAAGHKSKK